LQQIISSILKSQLSIAKIDKKAGFIAVTTTMLDENLAKLFTEKMVKTAVRAIINTKTQRQKTTVDKLQDRVDSIANLLRQKTISGASLQTSNSTMDINPLYKTGTTVAVETTVRDKTMLATIFASVVQNLELAKFTLSQETPVIQVVDSPQFPLQKNKMSRLKNAIQVSILSGLIFIILLVFKRVYKSFMN
jgi:hypothetical protein